MNLDLELILDILPLLVSCGAGIFAFVVSRRKDVDDRFKEVDSRFDQTNDRLSDGSRRMDRIDARVEGFGQELAAMPGKDDVHQLHLMLSDMRGDMKAMAATMGGLAESMVRLESIVSRHEEHLRDNH